MDDDTVQHGTNPPDEEQARERGTSASAPGPEGDVEGHGRLGPTAPKVTDDEDGEDVEGHVEPPRDRDLDVP